MEYLSEYMALTWNETVSAFNQPQRSNDYSMLLPTPPPYVKFPRRLRMKNNSDNPETLG